MTELSRDYEARAAHFRRLADAAESEAERATLLAIADQYEAVAVRLAADSGEP